jgi:tetratricopeptide (TPR) repeat protein
MQEPFQVAAFEEGVLALHRAVELDPDNAPQYGSFYSAMAAVCRAKNDYGNARRLMDEAMRLNSGDPQVLSGFADLMVDIGEYQAAVDAIDRIQQPDGDALATKAWCLENLGPQFGEEARRAYMVALGKEPPFPGILWLRKGLANALRLCGDADAARHEYETVIKEAAERPDEVDVSFFSLLGWCRYELGDYDEALRLLNEAVSAEPQDFAIQFDVALPLACSGRYGLALQQYRKTLDDMTQKADVLRQRGLLYVARDDLREAWEAQSALKDAPEIQESMALLEEAYNKVTVSKSANA